MQGFIKLLFFAWIIFAFAGCEEERAPSGENKIHVAGFIEFRAGLDTAANHDSALYRLLIDSLVKKLPNYEVESYEGKDVIKRKIFRMVPCLACSQAYELDIKLCKTNRSAFDAFSKAATGYIKDSAAINRFSNFEDIANRRMLGDAKYIYLDNMVIFLRCAQNEEVNFYLKKLLIGRAYKEAEFSDQGVFWTKK